jgi:hypothetical protein
MENYTNPEQAGQEQNPQDLLNASMLFARALGLIFKEDEGIVVDVNGDVKLGDDVKKVIVFRQNNQIHIFKCDEDVEEGMAVNLGPNPEEIQEPEETQEPETTQE